jgi:hypothetical protein
MNFRQSFIVVLLLVVGVSSKQDFFKIKPEKFQKNGRCQFVTKFYSANNQGTVKIDLKVLKSAVKNMNVEVVFTMFAMDKTGFMAM